MEDSENIRSRRLIVIAFLVLLVSSLIAPASAYAQDMSRTVWVSKTGSKYHYVQSCSGMRNPVAMTLSEAISRGKKPCSNCVRDSSGGSSGSSSGSSDSGSSGSTSGSGSSSGGSGSLPVQDKRIDPFSDIYESTAHNADVSWLYSSGVTTGWPARNGLVEFRPFDTVKRCDMAAFLYRLAGSPDYEPTEQDMARFSDVHSSSYHAKEIWWLASVGISTGFPDGTFRGLSTVTRCDMAAFLKRLAYYIGGDVNGMAINPFTDVSPSTYHRDEILWMVSSEISTGWTMGDRSREYRPMEAVARCDMAAFLHRLNDWCSRSSHRHDWVAETETVHHDAVTETVHHDAEYKIVHHDAEVEERSICNQCGADITGQESAHFESSLLNGGDCGGWHSEYVTVRDAYDETIAITPAYDETVTVGLKCSTCGAALALR